MLCRIRSLVAHRLLHTRDLTLPARMSHRHSSQKQFSQVAARAASPRTNTRPLSAQKRPHHEIEHAASTPQKFNPIVNLQSAASAASSTIQFVAPAENEPRYVGVVFPRTDSAPFANTAQSSVILLHVLSPQVDRASAQLAELHSHRRVVFGDANEAVQPSSSALSELPHDSARQLAFRPISPLFRDAKNPQSFGRVPASMGDCMTLETSSNLPIGTLVEVVVRSKAKANSSAESPVTSPKHNGAAKNLPCVAFASRLLPQFQFDKANSTVNVERAVVCARAGSPDWALFLNGAPSDWPSSLARSLLEIPSNVINGVWLSACGLRDMSIVQWTRFFDELVSTCSKNAMQLAMNLRNKPPSPAGTLAKAPAPQSQGKKPLPVVSTHSNCIRLGFLVALLRSDAAKIRDLVSIFLASSEWRPTDAPAIHALLTSLYEQLVKSGDQRLLGTDWSRQPNTAKSLTELLVSAIAPLSLSVDEQVGMVAIPGHLNFLEQQLFSASMQTFQPSFTHLCNVNYPDNLIQSIVDAGRLLDVPHLTNIRAVVALDVEMICDFYKNNTHVKRVQQKILQFSPPPPSRASSWEESAKETVNEPSVAQAAVLLQISTGNRGYLLDLPELGPELVPLLHRIFADPTILKVGLDFRSDMDCLRQTFPAFGCYKPDVMRSSVDVQDLFARVYPMFPHRVSLLNACLVAHGRPLRKSAQLSNWTLRPLSTEQMEYAALDVLTLPQVLSHLLTEATKSRTKISDLIQ